MTAKELSKEELRELIRKGQGWVESLVQSQSIPWAPLTRPVSQCRLALVTTGGFHLLSQPPFDAPNPYGDWSYREIPKETLASELRIAHDHYDHSDAEKDMNIVFPLERFRELEAEGIIGELASHHYSFMGYIPDPAPLVEGTAREVADKLKEAEVEAVFLTPA